MENCSFILFLFFSPRMEAPYFIFKCISVGVNKVLLLMHPRTFHIKNPSDAKLASLSILRKLPVSMASIVKNRKIQKSATSQYIFKLFSQYYFLDICVRGISLR